MIISHRINSFSASLIVIGLIALLGIPDAEATRLKDIRIGEYEGFTRIVFELDAAGVGPSIQPGSDGALSVSFASTLPDLNRKIPVERSRHVRNLKILHLKDELLLIFNFDFEHFSSESFPLENPPRIALDVHPRTGPIPASNEAKPMESAPRESPPTKVPEQRSTDGEGSPTRPTAATSEQVNPQHSPKTPETQAPLVPAIAAKTETKRPTPPKPATSNLSDARSQKQMAKNNSGTRPKYNGLQFYLVIALVLITIGILTLLLLMLFSKHRWTNGKDVPDVNEYLKHQDQSIASLNARIQEQLKRYEEA